MEAFRIGEALGVALAFDRGGVAEEEEPPAADAEEEEEEEDDDKEDDEEDVVARLEPRVVTLSWAVRPRV